VGENVTRQPAVELPCPNGAEHTIPDTSLGLMEWASKMARTHDQVKCAGCGLYQVWVRRPPGALAPCWQCALPKVDPATLAKDEDPICPQCRVEVAEREEVEQRERLARRWAEAT